MKSKSRHKIGKSRKVAPGIIEVAERAGVSPATVSRFYNTPSMVKPATRRIIEQAAEDLGYIRDRMAGALHNRNSGTFGLIVPTIDNTIFSELIESFTQQLQLIECTTLIACHNYNLENELEIVRSLLERRIDGVAIIGEDHLPDALEMLSIREVPVVALWGYREEGHMPYIGFDNAEAAYKATEHLIELGHRDIAFLFPDGTNNDRARARKIGALRAMSDSDIKVRQERIMNCPYSISKAKEMAITLMTEDAAPTAIMCGNDIIAQGVIFAALSIGLSLPEQLSVVGIGDFKGSAEIHPALTTVRLPAKRVGSLAADTLAQLVEGEIDGESQLLITELIIRQSTSRIG